MIDNLPGNPSTSTHRLWSRLMLSDRWGLWWNERAQKPMPTPIYSCFWRLMGHNYVIGNTKPGKEFYTLAVRTLTAVFLQKRFVRQPIRSTFAAIINYPRAPMISKIFVSILIFKSCRRFYQLQFMLIRYNILCRY